MEDTSNTQTQVTPTDESKNEGLLKGGDGKDLENKSTEPEDSDGKGDFTQDQVDKIVKDRLARESQKFDEKLKKAREEWEEMSKLSEKEREKALEERQKTELDEQRKELTLRENKLDGINMLNEKQVPIEFVDFFLHEDKEVMTERIEAFYQKWTAAIAEQVNSKVRGTTPTDPSANKEKVTVSREKKNYF